HDCTCADCPTRFLTPRRSGPTKPRPTPMEHGFVYYKVPAADTHAVAKCVRAMFNALGEKAPHARLLQRTDAESNEVTLMEVYEPVLDAARFAVDLARA